MNTEAEEQEVWSPCVSCDRKTFHLVLSKHVSSEYDYRVDTIHEMLKCRGCHSVSFRKIERDIESAYPIDEDEWHVPEEITNYPSVLEGHSELTEIWNIPAVVREIYIQSVQAMKDQSNILAGIGLRATIEAICNDQSIAGRTLEKRIDALAKGGLISQKDSERLHAIRFLGNDAAHEIRGSDPKSLLIALRIIEHLMINIYVLDNEADGRLDTILKSFDQFEKMLNEKLAHLVAGDEVPLAKIFGRDLRRLHGYLSSHEKELSGRIASGKYGRLTVGKIDSYAGSKEKLQHFVVT